VVVPYEILTPNFFHRIFDLVDLSLGRKFPAKLSTAAAKDSNGHLACRAARFFLVHWKK
jgi:hypothetical protein